MSPRAAWRLETLGFRDVYDYVGGKLDWFAAGLPRAGQAADEVWSGDLARPDVPTCGMDARLEEVQARVRSAGWDQCIVVNEEGIILGWLHEQDLSGDSAARVEDLMQSGPSTFRPSVPLEEMVDYLREHDLEQALISTQAGQLIGVLRRADAERQLNGAGPAGPTGDR